MENTRTALAIETKKESNNYNINMEMRIGIWNITPLNDKEYELTQEMDNYRLQALGLSETKKSGTEKQKITQNHPLYYSGVPRSQRAKKGVEIVVANVLDKRITTFTPVSPRVMWITAELEKNKHNPDIRPNKKHQEMINYKILQRTTRNLGQCKRN